MRARVLVAAASVAVGTAACEKARNNSSWSTAGTSPVAVSGELVPGAHPSRGVGPVTAIDAASLDAGRAAEGEELFRTRCSACHKVDERYIGPALAGITKRRQPEWIMNMILKPELMLQQDPVAMELLGQYLTPMANQNLTLREAESILVYFREHDKSLPAVPAESEPAVQAPETRQGPPGTN